MSLLILFNQPASSAVSASSATTDGADTLAANVAPIVSASSATTDGADTLAANAAPVVGTSSATTDGADVLAANADPVQASVSASAALTEGGDAVSAFVDTGAAQTSGAGSSRKVAIEHRGRIRLFESEEDAERWLESLTPKQEQVIAKLVKKVVAKAATHNALVPIVFDAPKVIQGEPQLRALVNMRAALLQGRLDQSIAQQLAKEQADRDDEDMAHALFLMMG